MVTQFLLLLSLLLSASSLLLSASLLILSASLSRLTPHTSHTLPVGLVGMLREVEGSPIRSWHLERRPPKGFGARSDIADLYARKPCRSLMDVSIGNRTLFTYSFV